MSITAVIHTSSQPAQARTGADDAGAASLPAVLREARESAVRQGLPYAGGVTPDQAWALVGQGEAILVDVRSAEELKFVGQVPEARHVAWATGTALTRNPRFLRELEAKFGKHAVILLLCRSGKRSALAAEAAAKGGFTSVFNVFEGFEGDLDEQQQRGHHNGWRHRGLPWVQD